MEAETSSATKQEEKQGRRSDWLLLLLALLSSFGCVFCSTRLALSIWEDRLTPASLLAGSRADYRLGPRDQMKFGFLDPLMVAGAATDSARLHLTPGKQATPVTIALLPRTPTPTGGAKSPPSLPEGADPTTLPAGPGTPTPGPSPTPVASGTGTTQATQTPVPGTPTTTAQPTTTPAGTPTAALTATPANTPTPQTTPTAMPTSPLPSPPPGSTDTPVPPPPATATETPAATSTPTDTPTATPESVSSILESVVDNGDGTCTAWWSYDNPNAFVVNISIGSGNRFNPAPDGRGQPGTFNPGRVMNVFSTVFSDNNLSWLLDGGSATAGPTGSCSPYRIMGTVFEDTDYPGGGPGTPFGGGDVGLVDVQVELYQGAVLVTTTTTDGSGQYLFSGLADGTYTVRVVSASIGDGSPLPAGVVAEQTYEHNGLAGNGGSGAMGGNFPGDDDTNTSAGAGVGDTNVPVTISGASLIGVDFGFADNVVVNTLDDGQGSLRQTLTNTNIIAGLDTVVFNIGTGQQTITPSSGLPAITDPVVIDGTTQDGPSGSPLIELDGSSAGAGVAGLSITAGNSTVRGLVINSFDWRGIELIGGGSNIIEGNYIGPHVDGLAAPGGGNNDGIHIEDSANNRIGGSTPSARNLISGNDYFALHVNDTASTGNVIQGNYIGVDITGTGPLGNVLGGVVIQNAANTTVTDNVIAYNGNDGVTVIGTTVQNSIQGNGIYANGDLGIDLADDGITPNDGSGDPDSGPNNLQNYPILDSAFLGSDLTVTGTLTSTANTEFRIELFAGTAGDPSGNGEGQFYLDFFEITTNGSGVATFTHSYTGPVPGTYLTVTATNKDTEDTSEFSPYLVLP